MDGKERVSYRTPEFFKVLRCRIARKQSRTRKGIAVGVKTGRWEPDQHVPFLDPSAIDNTTSLDNADNHPRQIILPFAIEPRHLCGLPADQCASVLPACLCESFDHLGRGPCIQLAGRIVIEEVEGLCAAREDVVHTMVDQILPDGVIPAHRVGYHEFRPYAIDA